MRASVRTVGGGLLAGAILGAGARFFATGGDEDTERFLWIEGADRWDFPAYLPWAGVGAAVGLCIGLVLFLLDQKKARAGSTEEPPE